MFGYVRVGVLSAFLSVPSVGIAERVDQVSDLPRGALGFCAAVPQVVEVAPGCRLDVGELREYYIFADRDRGIAQGRTYQWDGPCEEEAQDGLWADGAGTLSVWSRNGDTLFWYWYVRPDGAVRIVRDEAGVAAIRHVIPAIRYTDLSCEAGRFYFDTFASLHGEVQTAADVTDIFVIQGILARAAALARQECDFSVTPTTTAHLTILGLGANGQPDSLELTGRTQFVHSSWMFGKFEPDPAAKRRQLIREWNESLQAASQRARAIEEADEQERRRVIAEQQTSEQARRQAAAEQARRERQAELTQRRERLLAEWEERVERELSNTRPLSNLSDLLQHDRTRTLQVLAQGREIEIIMQPLTFIGGKFRVTNRQNAFDVDRALGDNSFSWDGWIRITNNPMAGMVSVTCIFDLAAMEGMVEGETYVVQSRLVQANDNLLVLECGR